MTLLITVFAAIVCTVKWYNNVEKICVWELFALCIGVHP